MLIIIKIFFHKFYEKNLVLKNIIEKVDSKKFLELTISNYCLNPHKEGKNKKYII